MPACLGCAVLGSKQYSTSWPASPNSSAAILTDFCVSPFFLFQSIFQTANSIFFTKMCILGNVLTSLEGLCLTPYFYQSGHYRPFVQSVILALAHMFFSVLSLHVPVYHYDLLIYSIMEFIDASNCLLSFPLSLASLPFKCWPYRNFPSYLFRISQCSLIQY